MAEFSGVIERIIYRSEADGYAIIKFLPDSQAALLPEEGSITAVGPFASLEAGERMVIEGEWSLHSRYGQQFRVKTFKVVLPVTEEGIARYLGSRMFPGIGPVFAGRIVDHFGRETIRVLDEDPGKLRQVDGIGPKRAVAIARAWSEKKAVRDNFLILQSLDIGSSLAQKIINVYGDRLTAVLKTDPYQMAEEVWGVSFTTCDRIATRMGLDIMSPARIEAGFRHLLKEAQEGGHTFLPAEELLLGINDLLKLSGTLPKGVLKESCHKGGLVADGDRIYHPVMHAAESGLAEEVKRMMKSKPQPLGREFEAELKKTAGGLGVEFSADQKQALCALVPNRVMILTGGPGTGKTTTVLGMVRLLAGRGLKVLLAAPTGRAAKRLSEATGRPAQTIHRLLEFNPGEMRFQRGPDKPLECDALVVDEFSMVDVFLGYHLLQALPPGARLIMIGDRDQLPSIGAGKVLADLIASGVVPVLVLKEIFRQARQSAIVRAAHNMINGRLPTFDNASDSDLFFIEVENPQEIADKVIELVGTRLPGRMGFDAVREIQVITPMHKGAAGTLALNRLLAAELNHNTVGINHFGVLFRHGDKVMQVRNNYTKEVFNGDIGWIDEVDREAETLKVRYDTGRCEYKQDELDEIIPAYAITVHKSQGSEYRAVVLAVSLQHFPLLDRNLVYTALTRARELMVVVGPRRALQIAVGRRQAGQRRTGLADMLSGRERDAAARG